MSKSQVVASTGMLGKLGCYGLFLLEKMLFQDPKWQFDLRKLSDYRCISHNAFDWGNLGKNKQGFVDGVLTKPTDAREIINKELPTLETEQGQPAQGDVGRSGGGENKTADRGAIAKEQISGYREALLVEFENTRKNKGGVLRERWKLAMNSLLEGKSPDVWYQIGLQQAKQAFPLRLLWVAPHRRH
ncbi:hypothetical protein POM88_010577 [Heracleum sosnowskyi]|uniref:Uncharacterized protein n=1 Tax=Heracleum sosnowskyi TaxID=360622 RepID=A0AAD8ITR7_9APIA|nr:hypothetical protein POM88_010577 [Heracleum sosnowskyi]